MNQDFSTKFTGWSFLAAVAMMWGGWMLIPIPVGPYVEAEHFPVVSENRYLFVWAFRFYFFGVVFFVVALVALAALISNSLARVIIWPGAAVAAGGAFAYALGSAFYYHHGYWGSLELEGQSAEAVATYIEATRFDSKYVTCFVRFGRLFSGLGVLLVSVGIMKWHPVPTWLGCLGLFIGLAAIAIVMASGDAFWVYAPVFHLQAIWLTGLGISILRKGLNPELLNSTA